MIPPLQLEEAQARLLGLGTPLAIETVRVEDALGRYLAAPLVAARTQPAADLSAMDGFAVAGPGPWRVIGESRAGHPFGGRLEPGQATRVSTGAHLPEGAEAVVLREDAEAEGGSLRSNEVPPPELHIRRRGFDFAARDVLAEAGERITPAMVALARSAGHAGVAVRKKPRVAILDSGDELVADPADCPAHRIPASNGAMLAAMLANLPCDVMQIGPVADNLDSFADALSAAEGFDVLVTSGGASVGDHDLVRPALENWGAQLDFWRVAIKPGKPLIVARRGPQIVLGLPGNPVSSYVTAFLFLLPLLRTLLGAATALSGQVRLPLASPLPATGIRREFVRAKLDGSRLVALNEQDSSALRSLASAQALIDRPVNSGALEAGELAQAYLLENG